MTRRDTPELSIRIAKLSTKLAQATTITGVILIATILVQLFLPRIPVDIILVPLVFFLFFTAFALIAAVLALITATTTGHLHETWEALIK